MAGIVVYDDKCSACTAFGTWGRLKGIGYSTKAAKKLMAAQFGEDYGFALMLFTDKKVYWGSAAAAEITRQSYSSFIGRTFNLLIHAVYPPFLAALTFILRRKTLPHPPRFRHKKLPESGSMLLTVKARKEFSRLAV
ncbi:hypothetical protein HYX10_03760 [Candidatus Woesearchaeota archaeon]|nr:hypothetical protein [Candidatus Woesearchaeota archaeon]